jgi:hypothetical protein
MKSTRLIALTFVFLLLSCGKFVTPIGDIKLNPDKYENKAVIVYGTVDSSSKMPFNEQGSFILRDDTGEIKVITGGALPKTGTKKLVKGKVQSNFVLFEKHFGVVIKED